MKKTVSFFAVYAIALLMLCGCFEKSFENKNLSFKGASSFDLCYGETKTLTIQLPDNGVETTLSVSVDKEGLTAKISDNSKLTLIGTAVGEYNITFTLSAKGYKSADAVFPVTVHPSKLPVSVFIGNDDVSEGLTLSYGETTEIKLKSDINVNELSLSCSDSSVIGISGSGGKYSITAKSAGSAVINIESSSSGYKTLSLPVKIEKATPAFSVSTQQVNAIIGGSAVIDCSYPDDSSIEISVSPGGANAVLDKNKISVTSTAPGSYTVTISCKGRNYNTESKTVTAVFSLPQLKFTAPSSLTMQSGDSTSFVLSNYPQGTVFSVSSGGKAAASVSGNTVSVTARAAGNDTVTVTAKANGYQSSSVKIPVTINAVSVKVSTKYDDEIEDIIRLVNSERISRGYSSLKYLPELASACTIRAKEISKQWSHTRPNGSTWETVLYDTGVNFKSGGENLLEMNALNPEEAVKAWMDSPSHRENILRPNVNATCVAIYKDGENYYYVQHFIER